MKKIFLLFMGLLCMGASTTEADLAAAIAKYDSDIETLESVEPNYIESTDFQILDGKVPAIFAPMKQKLVMDPTDDSGEEFIEKVKLLDDCVNTLSGEPVVEFPTSCVKIEKMRPKKIILRPESDDDSFMLR